MRLKEISKANIKESSCDVATIDDIEHMTSREYDKYQQWKADCEDKLRRTPQSEKRFEKNVVDFRKTMKEEAIISAMNKEDPNNPEVLIRGFGRLMLNQIEDSVTGKLKDLAKRSERRSPMEWEQIGKLLDTSTLKPMVEAINNTYDELERIRKAGGPKSRGIKKRI